MLYKFSYLIGSLTLLLIWIILFYYKKETRKEMIWISIIFGLAGLFAELVYVVDWWMPETITGTIIGIEDFLFGFAIGGIGSVVYEIFFNKKMTKGEDKNKLNPFKNQRFILAGGILIVLFFGLFYFFNINSFYASIIAFSTSSVFILIKRPDLIKNSILSGILLSIISFIGFLIPELITPGWVNSAWYFNNMEKIIIFNAPLVDIVWFFFAGTFIGPLYEFWLNKKYKK